MSLKKNLIEKIASKIIEIASKEEVYKKNSKINEVNVKSYFLNANKQLVTEDLFNLIQKISIHKDSINIQWKY